MKTHYSQPSVPEAPAPVGISLLAAPQDYRSNIFFWMFLSLVIHLSLVLSIWLVFTILSFFGLIPKFDNLAMKQRDVEFVLVDNAPAEKPRKPTNLRAERDSRSGGEKTPERSPGVPQQAAGAPNPRSAQPPARQQPRPQPAPRPTPQRQVAQTPARPQPQPQPQPQPRTPDPAPQPPAPKMPTPQKVASNTPALPPNPIAPTIKTPAPPNPSVASASGPIVKTPGAGSSSGGGSSSSGSPGPSMIGGSPSRGGTSSAGAASGGGGAGGTGAFSQGGSPGGGGGRPGVDAMAEPDFGPYIAELQRRIRRNWNPPVEDQSKRVVALFKISRDGRLIDLRIQKSSGSAQADQAALAAVRASAPFRQLPANYRGSDIDVQFIFDYEIFGNGNASRVR